MSTEQEVLGTQPAKQSGQVYWAVCGNHRKITYTQFNGCFSADHFINKIVITIIIDVFLSGGGKSLLKRKGYASHFHSLKETQDDIF